METPLSPTKSDVERAAHILGSFLPWRAHQILQEEGVSPECVAIGGVIAQFEKDEYRFHREVYGAREYGNRIIDESPKLRREVRAGLLEDRLKRGGSELERRVWSDLLEACKVAA
jgi:hypothetical protein